MSFANIPAIRTGSKNRRKNKTMLEPNLFTATNIKKREQLVYHLNKEVAAVLLYITTIRLGY